MSKMKRHIRPVERQPMREWLLDRLDSEELQGLSWVDREKGLFKVRWCHGSRLGWSKKDINVFEQWAKHTGRHYFGKERDEKRWKANFRCALNSLKTVRPVNKSLKGQNAFREYQIMDMKTAGGAALPRQKLIKREISIEYEEMDSQGEVYDDAHDDDDNHDDDEKNQQNESWEPHDDAKDTRSTPTKQVIRLPYFNKISPGLVSDFEYGKSHTIKRHYCGYTVTPLTVSSQEQRSVVIQYKQASSQDALQNGTDSIVFNWPDTPEDSLTADTETDQSEIGMYCVEITTSEADDTEDSSSLLSPVSEDCPLTPPYDQPETGFLCVCFGHAEPPSSLYGITLFLVMFCLIFFVWVCCGRRRYTALSKLFYS